MSWRLRLSVETILRLTPAVLGSTVFSIAGLCAAHACVPRYQRDMLRYFAQRDGTSVDQVLRRELEDVACAHSEELAAAVPGFALALAWRENSVSAGN